MTEVTSAVYSATSKGYAGMHPWCSHERIRHVTALQSLLRKSHRGRSPFNKSMKHRIVVHIDTIHCCQCTAPRKWC